MKNMRQFGILLLISIGMTVSGIAQVKVISPDERQMNLRFNQAQRFERQGQIEQAAEIYRYLVDNQPNNFSYYNNYVNLLFRQKNLPELERVITRFTQINPRNENAAVDLGKLYYMRGDSALAFREWQAALNKFNHTALLYNILFNEMIGLRLFDEAEALIMRARTHSNQPDFMTLELANFQIQRGKYITATGELLRYARANPRNYNLIAGQILRFPTDSVLFVRLDSLIQSEINSMPGQADLHRLRADILFKHERFVEAQAEIFQVETLTGFRGDQALSMAKNLVQIQRYDLAQDFYSAILANKELQSAAPQALLGLAEAFERAVLQETTPEPLHYFYPGNLFFNTDFVQQIEQDNTGLQKAFAIYDSLIVDQPKSVYSAQALYRLADLRFRVVRDLDGALNLFRRAQSATRDRQLVLKCGTRIGEVLIVSGDLQAATSHFRSEAERWEGTPDEGNLRVRLALTYFLAQEFDSLESELKNLVPLLGARHPLFNDVVSFDTFYRLNYVETAAVGQKAFGEFARAELLFRQNKLSEAEQVYKFLLQKYPDVPVSMTGRFRLTQIHLQFNRIAEAEAVAAVFFNLEHENADQMAYMLAEIADRRDGDLRRAAQYYEFILEKCPGSLWRDNARKRLRELHQIQLIKKES